MRNLITAIVLSITATSAMAENENRYIVDTNAGIFIDRTPTVECSNIDVMVGVAGGITAATILGVATAASLPVVGAGTAAGATVGWSGAFSAPFLTGTTIYTVAAANAIFAPIASVAGFYGSCVVQNAYDLW